MKAVEIGGMQKFDPSGDVGSVGIRWEKWLRGFRLYSQGKGVNDPGQMKALLLHSAGNEVQDIYYTLQEPDPGDNETVFDVTCTLLTNHFSPLKNVPYERSLFRATSQQVNETVEQFITRLRERAVYCEFGAAKDEVIRDQVIEKCSSHRLRRKLLEMRDLTLDLPTVQLRNCHVTNVGNKDILRRCARVKSRVVHQGRKDNNKVLELLTLS